MANDALFIATAHHKLRGYPVGELRAVQHLYVDVSVIQWIRIGWPILIAFFASFFKAPRQHYYRS